MIIIGIEELASDIDNFCRESYMKKIGIEEIASNIIQIIKNHPKYMMVESVGVKYSKVDLSVSTVVILKRSFQINSIDKSTIKFTLDFKYGYDEIAVSEKIYEVLNAIQVKEYFLYYDPEKEMTIKDIDKNKEVLSKRFFGKEFKELTTQERGLVLEYAAKAKYKNVADLHDAFCKFYNKYHRLPYDCEPLGKIRELANKNGYLSPDCNRTIDGIIVTPLLYFIDHYYRLPNENEDVYEKVYLPVVDGYKKGKYFKHVTIALDVLHIYYAGQSMGDKLFAEAVDQINNSYGLNIEKYTRKIKCHNYDVLGADDVSYLNYKGYKKTFWFFNDNNELVSGNLIITFKGLEHFALKDTIKELVQDSGKIKDNIDKLDLVFNDYCVEKDIPVLTVQYKDLVAGNAAIYKLISDKLDEISKRMKRPVYNSKTAAGRVLELKDLHNTK